MGHLATAALTFSKQLLARAVAPGSVAVDATVGNGHDTAFLAGLVGEGGVVHGFDIQAEALWAAKGLLAREGLADRVRLHHVGHERLAETLPEAQHGRVAAVVFNLGFLPGGEATVTTRPETTLAALMAACTVLAPGGVLAAVCYTGHPGGASEAGQVEGWCQALDFAAWRAARYELVNKPGSPIRLFFVEKHGPAA